MSGSRAFRRLAAQPTYGIAASSKRHPWSVSFGGLARNPRAGRGALCLRKTGGVEIISGIISVDVRLVLRRVGFEVGRSIGAASALVASDSRVRVDRSA